MSIIAELENELAYNQNLARLEAESERRSLAPVADSRVCLLDGFPCVTIPCSLQGYCEFRCPSNNKINGPA